MFNFFARSNNTRKQVRENKGVGSLYYQILITFAAVLYG
jgi:hypothetical protein